MVERFQKRCYGRQSRSWNPGLARFHGTAQVVRGIWEHEGIVYRDNNTRLVLDAEDSPENRAFFTVLKETLKKRFGQLDIWITSYIVDVI
jgi:hypothetical protein